MNKKSQSVIGFLFMVLMFIIIWVMFLANWLAEAGRQMIENNNLTGLEAFFYTQLNMVVAIVLIISIMAYLSFGGSSQ